MNNLSLHKNSQKVLITALVANERSNPRSMGVYHIRRKLMASIYEEHAAKEGSFISRNSIPSHIAAAKVDDGGAPICSLAKGTQLFQYVRPVTYATNDPSTSYGGYLGDYYAASPDVTASELGASHDVTDPATGSKIPRVQAELVVARVDKVRGIITTAAPVKDFWSIRDEVIDTEGGAEQYFVPVLAKEKQNVFVIVKPEGATPEQIRQLEAIAEKNGVRMLSRDELKEKYRIDALKSPYSRKRAAHLKAPSPSSSSTRSELSQIEKLEHERQMYDSLQRGHYEEAIIDLEQLLNTSNDLLETETYKACLGAIFTLIGREKEATEYLQSFLDAYLANPAWSHDIETKDFYFQTKHIFANTLTSPIETIKSLKELKVEMKQPSASSSSSLKSIDLAFFKIIDLDIAIAENKLAGNLSGSLTFHDFDSEGNFSDHKLAHAKNAEKYCRKSLKSDVLPSAEKAIALSELGFALRKQKRYEEAAEALLKAKDVLDNLRDKIGDTLLKSDIDHQILSVKLATGLSLCKCRQLKNKLKNFDKYGFMEELYQELLELDIVTRKFLFERWIGPSDADLFMVGWFTSNDENNYERGTRLIQLYREVFPLNIDLVCQNLENNSIEELELNYLGEKPPTGISDDDFERLMLALEKNTSLKKLYFRKFSNDPDPQIKPYRRFVRFAEALTTAQRSGQRLSCLSYSASRFFSEEALSMISFLSENESLVVFQPSLYDINGGSTKQIYEAYARAIARMPRLKTLLTGILNGEGGGKILAAGCMRNEGFKNLLPFLGGVKYTKTEKENNLHLLRAKHIIEQGFQKDLNDQIELLAMLVEKEFFGHFTAKSRKASKRKAPIEEMKAILDNLLTSPDGFLLGSKGKPGFKENMEKIARLSQERYKDKHPITIYANECLRRIK